MLVIFDLDGTLLNTIDDLGTATNHALEAKCFPTHAMSEYPAMVGHGIRNLMINALPEQEKSNDKTIDTCLREFVRYYTDHIDCLTRPYKGIPEMLADLQSRGIKLAVASNKFQAGAEILISKFFPEIQFSAILGNSPELPLKPDAGVVRYAMEKAEEVAENTLMVGDSSTDIKTARNAGIGAIGVAWGFRPRTDLEPIADFVADSVDELESYILKH